MSLARYRPARSFLFLQGLASPLFARLGAALAQRGFGVTRINVCMGDRLFWPRGSVDYCGRFEDWQNYLDAHLTKNSVTDVVLFGNLRPYHAAAIEVARARGIDVHVFEEGHLRPNWITVETLGKGPALEIPRDPAALRQLARRLGPAHRAEPVHNSFFARAAWDVAANFVTGIGRPVFRAYRRHRPTNAAVEYFHWSKRLAKLPFARRAAAREIARLEDGTPFYMLPLQLDSDYQIRAHSTFTGMSQVTELVVASFARNAPAGSRLVVKIHPLDNGMVDRRRDTARIAAAHGVADRVVFLDGGHTPSLIRVASGVVIVNSTVGTQAIFAGCPVKTLGNAVYDMPGLTFSGALDDFWTGAEPPDGSLADAFRRVLRKTQINGGFFSRQGIEIAVPRLMQRLGVPLPASQMHGAFDWAEEDEGFEPGAETIGQTQPH